VSALGKPGFKRAKLLQLVFAYHAATLPSGTRPTSSQRLQSILRGRRTPRQGSGPRVEGESGAVTPPAPVNTAPSSRASSASRRWRA
jgi:hypothetical protein